MSNKVATQYLHILQNQVTDEIQFLIEQNHYVPFISEPCIFCKPNLAVNGKYYCKRLAELQEFNSKLQTYLDQDTLPS